MSLALHSHSRPARAGFRSQIGHALSVILSAPARFVRHRQLLATMATMSDVELKDIGLARPDVSDATALPPGSDVGLFLSTRARDRDRYAIRR